MRIGIDARELCGRTTGAGRYLRGLLAEWSQSPVARNHEFVLYAPQALSVTLDARRFATRLVGGGSGTLWEQVRMPRVAARDNLDVFFSPAYTAPLFHTIPTVVAIHDVSFAAHPEWFTMREGVRRRWFTRQTAARAKAIITISEFSRRELVERLGAVESRIHVIPPGIAPPSSPRQTASIQATVLYVGSIFNRRHLPDLIRAFGALVRRRYDAGLDIVGDNRTYPRQDLSATIRAEGLNGRVRWRQYVDDEQLAALYGSSRAFAFLSEYEGLGMTPLEALSTRVPPVLLDTPVARESCGDAALYVPGHNLRAVTDALERLLYDDGTRNTLLAAAPAVLANYEWPRAARRTLAVIESCA